MIIGVPGETFPGERRVSLVPMVLPGLIKAGFEIVVESGAGVKAGYTDEAFAARGARIVPDRATVFGTADVIVQVLCYGSNDKTGHDDLPLFRPGQVVTGFMRPLGTAETVQRLAETGVTSFAVELMPRVTRAQSMDALTSMATAAGYRAVLLATQALPRFFPMLMTAAGTITPARVLVIGAGVAGLQAIATARRLGAVVSGYDLRPASKEQVASLGARFVELPLETDDAQDQRGYATAQNDAFYARQRELLGAVVAEQDVVITTAVVPGKKAPMLLPRSMVHRMAPGSVIVDMAAERGGNCESTVMEKTVVDHGVTIIGEINLASGVAYDASQMYARNLAAFLQYLVKDGKLSEDSADDIVRETLLTRGGAIVNDRVRQFFAKG